MNKLIWRMYNENRISLEVAEELLDCHYNRTNKVYQMWYTYIVRCSDNSLYTGVTTDLERRVDEHNTSDKGAKYTKTRRPVKLVYEETHTDRSSSCKRESEIKKLSRTDKLKIINERRVQIHTYPNAKTMVT